MADTTTYDEMLHVQMERPGTNRIGILVEDATHRRLLEGIASHLDLHPVVLEEDTITVRDLSQLEMVVADVGIARGLRKLVSGNQSTGQPMMPALVAVVTSPATPASDDAESGAFDAVLTLPEKPTTLTAQIGVALYSHRAFTHRYQGALEELALHRNIFKSVTNGISVANALSEDLPLTYVNPAFEVMTGYSLEEVQGKNCRFLQRGERDQPGVLLVREAIAQRRETVAVLRNFRKDGTPFWNELAISPIFNADGVLTHFVGIQSDVTERVEFESALRESEKLAAVGRLASTIAHEINNPLEAIMNLVYLGRQTLPASEGNREAAEYLAQADEELRRVKQITARSLRFYKQSDGPTAVRAGDLIGSVLDVYGPRFANYNITIERRERSTEHIVCLASEVRQVIGNLVTNAIDAMKATGGWLLVRSREATHWPTGRKGVLITVADTGPGMTPEVQANLYRAFYTTKGESGTGLGLWISAEIVQRHHGHLSLRSRQESTSGAVFEVFLPFQGVAGLAGSAVATAEGEPAVH